ncbi:coiled-coil domain-containing protein [Sesbania bispinosa]|nr:coiled-coil domain-containing protein [Sesbania bispinosa]
MRRRLSSPLRIIDVTVFHRLRWCISLLRLHRRAPDSPLVASPVRLRRRSTAASPISRPLLPPILAVETSKLRIQQFQLPYPSRACFRLKSIGYVMFVLVLKMIG